MKGFITAILAVFTFCFAAFWQPPKPPKQEKVTTSDATPEMFTAFNKRPNFVFVSLIFDPPPKTRRFTNFKFAKVSDFTDNSHTKYRDLPIPVGWRFGKASFV